jgi:alanine racemase
MNHHSIVEISKSALLHNIASYKAILNPQALLAPVIKSNAYGHGIVEVASILDTSTDIGYLCVVSVSEALQLKAHGISKPILVLSIIDGNISHAIQENIDLVAYDLIFVKELNAIAQRLSKKARIHLKIDTGLSRLGIHHHEVKTFVEACAKLTGIEIIGIFSHFAASERSDLSFSHLQMERFFTITDQLEKSGIHIPLKHFASSAAITSLPESHLTFARLGISTYGLWSSVESKVRMETVHPNFFLRPVMQWKTRVIARKTIPVGSYVGYDCTYQTPVATETAVLPIGYYDGYDRRLSNQSFVKIKNQLFPVRGRIAMNLCIVDVTTCPEIMVGDEVTLLGTEHLITAEILAEQCRTINYEFVARINPLIIRKVVE